MREPDNYELAAIAPLWARRNDEYAHITTQNNLPFTAEPTRVGVYMNYPQSLRDSPPASGGESNAPAGGGCREATGVVRQDGRPPITIYQSSLPCGWVGWVS